MAKCSRSDGNIASVFIHNWANFKFFPTNHNNCLLTINSMISYWNDIGFNYISKFADLKPSKVSFTNKNNIYSAAADEHY